VFAAFVNVDTVAVANRLPVPVQKFPIWVTGVPASLVKRIPVTDPLTSARNVTPISTALSGPPSATAGVEVVGQIVELVCARAGPNVDMVHKVKIEIVVIA
jgi:hypothetical protein